MALKCEESNPEMDEKYTGSIKNLIKKIKVILILIIGII
jgi:hypothetical protein